MSRGAEVYRANRTARLGDFLVVFEGKVYALELKTSGTAKGSFQLSAVNDKLGTGVTKLPELTVADAIKAIFGQ